MLRELAKLLLTPTLALFLVGFAGWCLRKKLPRSGRALMAGAVLLFYALCMPVVSASLLRSLQTQPPLLPGEWDERAGAVVVFGAGFDPEAREYGHESTVDALSLVRMRYAGWLARRTELPVLIAGGALRANAPPLAELGRRIIADELGAEVRWLESRSGNTRQNAYNSAEILQADGIRRIYLVTHAWHMPRALAECEEAGLEVIPAPTGFRAWPGVRPVTLLPSARSLRESTWALHEWLGRAWYAWTR